MELGGGREGGGRTVSLVARQSLLVPPICLPDSINEIITYFNTLLPAPHLHSLRLTCF